MSYGLRWQAKFYDNAKEKSIMVELYLKNYGDRRFKGS